MVPGLILVLIFFSLVLIKAAEMVVVALRRVAAQTHTGVFALAAILLALGTSFPELFVALTSSLESASNLSFGNVLGANIANLSLVAGFSALIAGRVNVRGDFLKRDVGIALAAGVLPILLVLDGDLSRVDGLILITTYLAYATSLFRERFIEIAEEHKKESFFYRFVRQFNHINGARKRELGRLFIGVALLLFSADMIVRVAKQIAVLADLPVFLVGLVILSIGTTLPEIAFSLRSVNDHEPGMFFGNILGSIIANSTLVLGVAVTISPFSVVALEEYKEAVMFFVLIFLAFWFFVRSKMRLDRWEAGVLLLLYTAFVVTVFV